MSYCRWSTDNFGCDLYCYESRDGYVIHVAHIRILDTLPDYPSVDLPYAEFMDEYNRYNAALDAARREPIDLPGAGESYTLSDLEEFAYKLRELRDIGYRFPDTVFEMIEEEMNDER